MFNIQKDTSVYYKIDSGSAYAETKLNAFDRSLLVSGCGNYNLLRVSSILPPSATESKSITLPEGSLLSVAYASLIVPPAGPQTAELSAAVSIGIPEDSTLPGVIMEYSAECSEPAAVKAVEEMVHTAMHDRGVSNYKIKSAAASCTSSADKYTSVFAYVAIFS